MQRRPSFPRSVPPSPSATPLACIYEECRENGNLEEGEDIDEEENDGDTGKRCLAERLDSGCLFHLYSLLSSICPSR
ncbi:hypothetical protein KP509_06G078000 [Ceratopteris richardii]|nr:hypothetical protein KP509_06G078000 [Ceratopteris richardii]